MFKGLASSKGALIILLAALSLATAPLRAAELEAPAAIRAAIRAALRPSLAGIKGATAKIACPSPDWTIYVPIRLHAWVEAVVAATNLAPNTRLTADNLARGRVDMFASPGELVTSPARAEGRVLEVGLLAGAPILKSFLKTPFVVHRGEKVLLTLTDRTMVIRDTAVALDNGRVGDSIAVRNPESGKIVHATVAEDGTVAVRF